MSDQFFLKETRKVDEHFSNYERIVNENRKRGRSPDFDVTLSHVTDFPNARQALWFRFFHNFRKKFKKVAPKAGTGWCLHPWLIDLKRVTFGAASESCVKLPRRTGPVPTLRSSSQKVIIFRRRRSSTGFPRFRFASLNVKSASRKNRPKIKFKNRPHIDCFSAPENMFPLHFHTKTL